MRLACTLEDTQQGRRLSRCAGQAQHARALTSMHANAGPHTCTCMLTCSHSRMQSCAHGCTARLASSDAGRHAGLLMVARVLPVPLRQSSSAWPPSDPCQANSAPRSSSSSSSSSRALAALGSAPASLPPCPPFPPGASLLPPAPNQQARRPAAAAPPAVPAAVVATTRKVGLWRGRLRRPAEGWSPTKAARSPIWGSSLRVALRSSSRLAGHPAAIADAAVAAAAARRPPNQPPRRPPLPAAPLVQAHRGNGGVGRVLWMGAMHGREGARRGSSRSWSRPPPRPVASGPRRSLVGVQPKPPLPPFWVKLPSRSQDAVPQIRGDEISRGVVSKLQS